MQHRNLAARPTGEPPVSPGVADAFHFAALADLSSDALLVLDETRVVYANPAALTLFQPAGPALVGLPLQALWQGEPLADHHPWDDDRLETTVHVRHGEPMALRARRTMAPRHYLVALRPAYEGGLAHRVRETLGLTDEPAFVIDSRSGEFLDVTPAACAQLGLDRAGALRCAPGMLRRRDGTGMEHLPTLYAGLQARSPQAQTHDYDLLIEGRPPLPLAVTWRALQLDGRWLIYVTWQDITERVAAMALVQQFKDAFDQTPEAINIVDVQSLTYVYVNEAFLQLTALPREQVMRDGPLSMPPETFVVNGLAEFSAAVVAQYPNPCVREQRLTLPDGRTVTLEVRHQAIFSGGRWLVRGTRTDITARKAAEAALQRLKAVVDVAPDGMYIIDPATLRFLDVNQAAAEMFGVTPQWLLDNGLEAFMSRVGAGGGAQAVEDIRREYALLIEGPATVRTSERRVRPPGRMPMVVEFSRRAVRLDDRWLILAVARDITERKAAQAHVERLAAVVDQSVDAIFLIDFQTLTIIDANEAASRMFGYPREALKGMQPHRLTTTIATVELLARQFQDVIHMAPKAQKVELVGLRRDGTTFDADATRQALWSGGRWIVVTTLRDITAAKAAQARLGLLRQAYDAALDGILISDPDTLDYLDVNQAAVDLLGVPREQLMAHGVAASYHSHSNEPFDPERFRRGYRHVIAQAPQAVFDERTLYPLGLGGRAAVIEFSRRAVNIDGRWIIVTLMRDVTAARRAEAEIRQHMAELTRSNQELEQYGYVISHDLSEPLRMVSSYVQLLERRYGDRFDDDGREFMAFVLDGTQRMKQLIDDLLAYSRAGRPNVQMRRISLDRALDDALANLANAIERTGATIERMPLPTLVAERAGMTQLFQNLIGNAIKFHGDATPVVSVGAIEGPTDWTVWITDNGIGIAPEFFQRIFIIFQRLHGRARYDGTGIGLSICKKIVERHGGTIMVESQPGRGTTFRFTLSKALEASQVTNTETHAPRPATIARGLCLQLA